MIAIYGFIGEKWGIVELLTVSEYLERADLDKNYALSSSASFVV